MEKLTLYREIVANLVREYAGIPVSHGQVESYPVIDPVRDHYLAVQAGWDRRRRVQGAFLHLDIIDGKIWIQYDGTDWPIATELVQAGVPREDIVLGDRSPRRRAMSGFAVG